MSSVSVLFTMTAKVLLVLLPGVVFPAIYLAYLRTRSYRVGDINRLAGSVSTIRPGRVDTQTSEELKKQLLDELDDLYNWKNYAVSLAMSCLAAWIATEASSRNHGNSGLFVQPCSSGRVRWYSGCLHCKPR